MIENCDKLDDYLDGTLSDEHRQRFRRHLDGCTACREAVEASRKIERLLQQATLVDPPVQLRYKIKRQWHDRARRRRLVVGVSLTAAAAAIGIYFSLSWQPANAPPLIDTPPTASAPIESRATAESAASKITSTELPSPSSTAATITTGDDVLAVRQPTRHANVSLFLLFPTVRTAANANNRDQQPLDSSVPENAL
jgi:anti-sigma factor (TIGR02949 family)